MSQSADWEAWAQHAATLAATYASEVRASGLKGDVERAAHFRGLAASYREMASRCARTAMQVAA